MVMIGDVGGPEAMSLEHCGHVFNGYSSSLRQEEVDEEGHDKDEGRKEEEEAEVEMAEHGEEGLRDDEGEEHVDGDVDGLSGGANLEGDPTTMRMLPQRRR